MANVMKLPDLKGNASRSGFDLTQKVAFTAKTGEILPVALYHTLPNDKFKIKLSAFSRTMPVETAAFTRIREYYDVFFVPYSLLWNKFDTFITQMNDNQQYAADLVSNVQSFSSIPYTTTEQLAKLFADCATSPEGVPTKKDFTKPKNSFGFNRSILWAKLLSFLEIGDFEQYSNTDIGETWEDNPKYNEKMQLFPMLAYQKIYMDHYRYEQWEKYDASCCNVDWITKENQLNVNPNSWAFANKIGNFLDLRYCNFERDFFFGVLPQSQYGSEAVVSLSAPNPNFGVDYFTSSQPQFLTGLNSSNIPIIADSAVTAFPSQYSVDNKRFTYLQSYVEGKEQKPLRFALSPDVQQYIKSSIGVISVLGIRAGEYLQKWKEIAQSGNQDYKSQIEKFWNCKVPVSLSHMSFNLGGMVSNLDISEVVNQNITADNQADIAGQGRGSGSGFVEFDASKFGNQYGIVMVLYHNRPLLDYSLDRCNPMNKKIHVNDFAHPSFDKLGMQQIHLLDMMNTSSLYKKFNGKVDLKDMYIGYAPRYAEYKTNVDLIKGGFRYGRGGLQHWCAPVTDSYIEKWLSNSDGFLKYDYNVFKVNPQILNPIFIQAVDSYESSDQFLINAQFDIDSVRDLDYNGLPY